MTPTINRRPLLLLDGQRKRIRIGELYYGNAGSPAGPGASGGEGDESVGRARGE